MRAKKGWRIQPIHFPGSDFKILKSGKIVSRKPTKADIEYYEIIEPCGIVFCREFTIQKCREIIDYASKRYC